MDRQEAINLLGGDEHKAAAEVGITVQAVKQWPDPLPRTIADRVLACLWRKAQGIPPPPLEKRKAQGEVA